MYDNHTAVYHTVIMIITTALLCVNQEHDDYIQTLQFEKFVFPLPPHLSKKI